MWVGIYSIYTTLRGVNPMMEGGRVQLLKIGSNIFFKRSVCQSDLNTHTMQIYLVLVLS